MLVLFEGGRQNGRFVDMQGGTEVQVMMHFRSGFFIEHYRIGEPRGVYYPAVYAGLSRMWPLSRLEKVRSI